MSVKQYFLREEQTKAARGSRPYVVLALWEGTQKVVHLRFSLHITKTSLLVP